MTMLTSSTSLLPILSAFEMSHLPPEEAESTPAVPRACSLIFFKASFQSDLADINGKLTIVPARSPVPRFDGHVRTHPKWSLCMKSDPSVFSTFCTSSHARTNRPNVSFMFLSRCMLTILKWSSSPTHTNRCFESLWNTPRPSGQCRPMPLASSSVLSGSWKRFPIARSSFSFSSDIPLGFAEYECDPCSGK
ncbi:hypothetical protein DIPPA_24692 [Diplonema papillatum]|nr:hypothetical protein DIPPA_24692 [Diplonema papillatum]